MGLGIGGGDSDFLSQIGDGRDDTHRGGRAVADSDARRRRIETFFGARDFVVACPQLLKTERAGSAGRERERDDSPPFSVTFAPPSADASWSRTVPMITTASAGL